MHRAVPRPQDHLRGAQLLGGEAAAAACAGRRRRSRRGDRPRSQHGGVAAEVLVGEEEAPSRPARRPTRATALGVGRGADRAAVAAGERLDRGGGVHVGDRDGRRRRRPASTSASHASSTWPIAAMSAIEQPAARSGRITCWSAAVRMSALSAMKCTPQKTMNSASGCAAASRASLNESPVTSANCDDLVALVVVAEDEARGRRAPPCAARARSTRSGSRGGGQVAGALDAPLGVEVGAAGRAGAGPAGSVAARSRQPCRSSRDLPRGAALHRSTESRARAARADARLRAREGADLPGLVHRHALGRRGRRGDGRGLGQRRAGRRPRAAPAVRRRAGLPRRDRRRARRGASRAVGHRPAGQPGRWPSTW